ncbi:MAG: hypothetical protein GC168_08520 [Candidatus Hydrogenedens sp.]|nr:hypothetical protein [Candidatus Hydrogenedens sp.]
MRLVIVNHCHPDTPHVCARRAAGFAEALAAQGHRVVLLTETLAPDDPAPVMASLMASLDRHDWRTPLLLATPPEGGGIARAAREGRLPAGLRQAVLAGLYLGPGGLFPDWTAGSRRVWPALAERFRPELVWGIFGNTDAWRIARGLARAAGCPWVADIKDYWRSFIPAPLRAVLARRFADAAAMTCLSESNRQDAELWFRQAKTVIYSGLDQVTPTTPPGPPSQPFRLELTGGLYDQAALDTLVAGLSIWLGTLTAAEREPVVLSYTGTDGRRAAAALRPLQALCRVEVLGYVALERLAALQESALANLYIATPRTFHSKVFELFRAGRPILCCPGDSAEVTALAGRTGARLAPCATPAAVCAGLDDAWTRRYDPTPPGGPAALAGFSRDRQTAALAELMAQVLGGGAP